MDLCLSNHSDCMPRRCYTLCVPQNSGCMGLPQHIHVMARPFRRARFVYILNAVLALVCLAMPARAQASKHVLIINELGPSHPGPVLVTNEILTALYADARFQVTLYAENLDAVDASDEAQATLRKLVIQKYERIHLDLIVLIGPDPYRLLAGSPAFFPGVPVVFCCSAPSRVGDMQADPNSTGAWIRSEPEKSLDVALRLLPATRQVFVVGGQSRYDQSILSIAKAGFASYESRLAIAYLTDLPMAELQEKLRHLPGNSIVLFLSFFRDVRGEDFVPATKALPMIAAASNAPVFGVSDSYLGHGIVGGYMVSFEEQGKIAARDSVEVLSGKPPQEIPAVYAPNVYRFDWRELRRWKIKESRLPPGSVVLFRQPGLWERYKFVIIAGIAVILFLSALTIYLLFKQKQLNDARAEQERLSRMLINNQEAERKQISGEIHDEFSQRLAALSLGLATTAQIIQKSPQEANRQLQSLSDEMCKIAEGLYTLSHRLYSATLETLGPAPAVRSFCADFSAKHGIEIQCTVDPIPRSAVHPDVALCVFRIVQESLRNMWQHSRSSSGKVNLQMVDGTLHLYICDRGIGFNPRDLKERQGLGIRSMEERVRLLGGQFEIRSKPGQGTTIETRLSAQPVSADALAQAAL